MLKKILVVDDDESILDAVQLILVDEGYIVETTSKGDQIYAHINTFSPDLILLDVLMSGNDGRHICHKLKQDIATKNIPIIMISAHPSAEKSIKECGADTYLAKPFETEKLIQMVSDFLSQ